MEQKQMNENRGIMHNRRGLMRRKRFRMSSRMLAVVLIVVCIAAGSAIAAFLWDYRIAEVKEIPMSFFVENIGGINVGTDALYFGSVPRGSSSSRKIHIEADEELVVTAIALGNISSVVAISENNFMVVPGEKKTIELVATAPLDDPYITAYNGTLRLVFRRF